MAIPKYYEMYKSFLTVLLDGKVHTIKEEKQQVIKDFRLSENEIAELLPSGKQTVFDNRIGWCRTYLKKAGLIVSPCRGQYQITDAGHRTYLENNIIDDTVLKQFPSFVEFAFGDRKEYQKENDAPVTDETPQETMDRVYKELNQSLANDLLTEISEMNPYRFEVLVVELLVKMGYGRLQYENRVTRKSGDEGIDGIVNGIGKFVNYGSRQVRWLQSGQVGAYILLMVLGILGLFIIQLFL